MDLSGLIFLYLSFILFQLLVGKIQFGVILGWIVVFSILLYVVLNMLAGWDGKLDLHGRVLYAVGGDLIGVVSISSTRCFCVVGD